MTDRASNLFPRCFLAIFTIVFAAAGSAHHSYQMFDSETELKYVGEIIEVEWTNPHVWIFVDVTDAQGNSAGRYGFECRGGIAAYQRQGWTPAHFAPGTKVEILANPLRNGQPGAGLLTLALPNGAVFGTGEGPDAVP